ncbi:MAG: ATP-binding cassette domain-containing protein [Candidatus Margulisiibacteriota bacterium]
MANPVIEVKDLTKKFNGFTAVDSVNFEVDEGCVFGLLGPNGAGKTTTISMLSTLLRPTSGAAHINGHDVQKDPAAVRRSIGIVFQDPSSDDILTGRENLLLHCLLFDVPNAEIKSRIEWALKLVDLTEWQNTLLKKYSGGMRRRLELARGLLHKPRILFLDEPTLGLDPQARENIWVHIENLVKVEKVSIILTTHYMEEADRLCDRVAIIDHGKIIVSGTPTELKTGIPEPKRPPEVLKATLHDVFLYYTGKQLRESGDTAEGGFMQKVMNFTKKNR